MSTDPAETDDVIVITGVRYHDRQNPAAKVHIMLRTVTPRMVANHPRQDNWSVFISARGHAGRLQPYGTYVPGRYTTEVAGHEVTETCDDVHHTEGLLRDGKPDQPLTSLVFAIKIDRDGARLHHYFVDYTINGEPRTLRIDWTMGGRPPDTFNR